MVTSEISHADVNDPAREQAHNAVIEIDARGLKCPLPVLKARKAMKSVTPDAQIVILADDAAAPKDFAAFCETTGARLISDDALPDGGWRFVLAAP